MVGYPAGSARDMGQTIPQLVNIFRNPATVVENRTAPLLVAADM
jgi:hypothetical protein